MNYRVALSMATTTVVVSSSLLAAPALASQLVQGTSYYLDFERDANGNDLTPGNGELIDDEWAAWGLDITADSYRSQAQDLLLLYDTSKGGKDNDLRTGQFSRRGTRYTSPAEGNALIIHEDISRNSIFQPDDEAKGGLISFDFTAPLTSGSPFYNSSYVGVELGKIRLIDIDDNPTLSGVSFEAIAGNRTLFSKTAEEMNSEGLATSVFAGIDRQGNNSIWDFDLGAILGGNTGKTADTAITKLLVKYDGSGAIAGLDWTQLKEDDDPARVPEPAGVVSLLAVGLCAAGAKLQRRTADTPKG